jgi:gliding motility-associated-like protein
LPTEKDRPVTPSKDENTCTLNESMPEHFFSLYSNIFAFKQVFTFLAVNFVKMRSLRKAFSFCILVLAGKYAVTQPLLQFTENRGQWDERILYEADILSGKLYLEKEGFTYFFLDQQDIAPYLHHKKTPAPLPGTQQLHYHVLKTRFLGSRQPVVEGKEKLEYYKNFFHGSERSRWTAHVPVYYSVRYKDVYPGISLVTYTGDGKLKYDWQLEPGADVSDIKVRYEGAEDLFLSDGRLYIRLSFSSMVEDEPEAYQYIGDGKVKIPCRFVLKNKVLSYELGDYDKNYPLIIDPPVLIFSTYSGSTSDNFGFTATYDSRGNLYSAGNVTTPETILPGGRFPATAGAFQTDMAEVLGSSGPYAGFPCDMAISKYDSSGSKLVWATYLGGTNNDYPHSLVADINDNLLILGSTYSTDFPVDTLGFDTSHNGLSDIVVVKLNHDASELLGATFLGGKGNDGMLTGPLVFNFADNYRGDIYADPDNQVYIASCSRSDSTYPVTPDALQLYGGGGYDGVLTILDSSLRQLVWSSYIGGHSDDAFYSLKLDNHADLIAAGGTTSSNLSTTPDALFPAYQGGPADGMAIKIDLATRTKKAFTYYGTPEYDQIYFIDFDLKNNIYFNGQTKGNMPLFPTGVYGQAAAGVFITKLTPDMDTMLMSTTIGSRPNNPNFSPTAFLIDNCYNIYFSGWGADPGVGNVGSTLGLPITPDAAFPATDGDDFYLGVLDKDAGNLIYATFFGGTQTSDHVDGGTSRFDKKGIIYHSICGSCPPYPCCMGPEYFISDIPTTPGAAFPTNESPRCSNASFKFDFQITYAVEASFTAAPKSGCGPLTVSFTNRSGQASGFLWNFGDGGSDTSYHAVHTYAAPGTYTATLHVTDSFSCNLSDSAYTTIVVFDKVDAGFDFSVMPCAPGVTFKASGQPARSYFWDFGDGTTSELAEPEHEFPDFGYYEITLITNPNSICADTHKVLINVSPPAAGDLFIPNVFTPNADGINSCYEFPGLISCDKVKVEIFNRWGQMVYKTDDPGFCWTGADYKSGDNLPEGVYYVIASIQQAGKPVQEYKGTVTLVR